MMELEDIKRGIVIPATQIEEVVQVDDGDSYLSLRASDGFEERNTIYFHLEGRDVDPEAQRPRTALGDPRTLTGYLKGYFFTLNPDSFYLDPSERVWDAPFLFANVLIDKEAWLTKKIIQIGASSNRGRKGGYWDGAEVASWNAGGSTLYIIKTSPSSTLLNWINENPLEIK
jgi:hypothetical protein